MGAGGRARRSATIRWVSLALGETVGTAPPGTASDRCIGSPFRFVGGRTSRLSGSPSSIGVPFGGGLVDGAAWTRTLGRDHFGSARRPGSPHLHRGGRLVGGAAKRGFARGGLWG